jgi:hypothetical protein
MHLSGAFSLRFIEAQQNTNSPRIDKQQLATISPVLLSLCCLCCIVKRLKRDTKLINGFGNWFNICKAKMGLFTVRYLFLPYFFSLSFKIVWFQREKTKKKKKINHHAS